MSLVKPEKARAVEDSILRAAQSGQLGGKVDETQLIGLLDQISKSTKKTKITVRTVPIPSLHSPPANWLLARTCPAYVPQNRYNGRSISEKRTDLATLYSISMH